jgi:hypothetical protein
MSVYPGNTSNASTFNISNGSYPFIEPIYARDIPCPYLQYIDALDNQRINGTTLIPFITNGTVEARVAQGYFAMNFTNISLPTNLDGPGVLLVLQGSNDFSSAYTNAYYPFGTIPPGPNPPGPNPPGPNPPGPDKKGSGLTWLWILLGIVGVILVIAAIVWVIRNKRQPDEALLDNQDDPKDVSLQHA